jgi:hypothetical protein
MDGIHQTLNITVYGWNSPNSNQILRWNSPKLKSNSIFIEFNRLKSRFSDKNHQSPKKVKQLNLQKLKSSVGMRFAKPDLGWNSHSSSIYSLSL